jgi:D-sedoheptulose 7-phosphate isomerase
MSATDTLPTPLTGAAAPKLGDELPDASGGVRGYVSDYLSVLSSLLSAIDPAQVEQVVGLLYDLWRDGRRLVLCGNGGSGSTSSHLVCDFQKNILLDGGKPFEVVALTDSPALLLAWGNDTDFANVFAGQARTWLRPGDVLIAISGSGNSPNVLRAVEVAKEVGATSIGLCGYGGGKLAAMADISIVANRRNMQQVEDVHMILGHVLFSALRDRITGALKG